MKKRSTYILWTIVVIAVVALGAIIYRNNTAPGKYDSLAQCLKSKGATFYGAFWCPHCQNQKAEFGSSAKYLPYIECSTADGNGQLPVCTDKKIQSYPTWEFADGSRLSGEIPLATLADKTGCTLNK